MWYCVRYEISKGGQGMAIFPTKEIWEEEKVKQACEGSEFFALDHMDFLSNPE